MKLDANTSSFANNDFKIATNPTNKVSKNWENEISKKENKATIQLYDQVIITNIFMCMYMKNVLVIKAYIVLTIYLYFWCYKWPS